MDITGSTPTLQVGNGMDGFGGGFGMMFLAFLAIMGMGGGMFGGNRGPATPNNVATTDTVNQAVQYSSLVDQNRDLTNSINNSQMYLSNQVADKYSELQRDIAANAVTLANLQAHQAECCCQIRQEIAAQTLRQQEQFGQMQLQTQQQFAALNSKMDANTIQQLRDQIQQLREQNFVQYPRGFVYSAGGNPFCGCGNIISA